MRRKVCKAVSQEEPHGNARGVRRKAQKIDVLRGKQRLLQKFTRLSLRKKRQRPADVLFLYAGVCRNAEQRHGSKIRVRRARVFRPADDGRVAEHLAVVPVGQQRIERRGVGKGRVFADRRVLRVFVAVGPICVRVERDQRAARALRAAHALDGRMRRHDRRGFSRDQTLCAGRVRVPRLIVPLPRGL